MGRKVSAQEMRNYVKKRASGGGGSSAVSSVNGLTGAVVLGKVDIGLNNVDNTSDALKPISTATSTALSNKVDKVAGKSLSTNDYTDGDKAQVHSHTNKTMLDSLVSNGDGLKYLSNDGQYKVVPTGVSNYLALTDTPNSYLGKQGQVVSVNATENALEFKSIVVPTKVSELTNDLDFIQDSEYVHTDENFTFTEKSKLATVAYNAELNVQSDWNMTDTNHDAFIKNKPTIPTVISTFSGLTDTPNNYSGSGGKVVKVKTDETGLEYGVSTAINGIVAGGSQGQCLIKKSGLDYDTQWVDWNALKIITDTYTTALTDNTVLCNFAVDKNITLNTSVPFGWRYDIKAIGNGAVTITNQIDGTANIKLNKGAGLTVVWTGSMWYAIASVGFGL